MAIVLLNAKSLKDSEYNKQPLPEETVDNLQLLSFKEAALRTNAKSA